MRQLDRRRRLHPRGQPAQLRIERAIEPVAEQVEGGDEQQQRQAGEERHPWREAQLALALEDHAPPAHRVLIAEAEEAQARLGEDREAHQDRRVGDDRRQPVGDDVAREGAQMRGAGRARGLDIDTRLQAQHLCPHDSGRARPGGERDRDHRVFDARAEQRDDQQHEEEGRDQQEDVEDPAQHRIGPAAEIAGQRSEHDAEQARDRRGDDGDEQGELRAPDQPREDVAPEIIGAEKMSGAGRRIGRRVHRARVDQRQEGRGKRGDDRERDHAGAERKRDAAHQSFTRGSSAA